MQQEQTVLFLCTGNSARSIMAEGILRKDGAGRFKAYSGGAEPSYEINPWALKTLETHGYPTDGYKSKKWDEFADPEAYDIDFVFTVCDSAADEVCRIWLGQPLTTHWGISDPAAVKGTDEEISKAFNEAFYFIKKRIDAFLSLDLSSLNFYELKHELNKIGELEGATKKALMHT